MRVMMKSPNLKRSLLDHRERCLMAVISYFPERECKLAKA